MFFMCEAANSAVLDSACSKTVTGHIWKEMYLDSLSVAEKAQVKFLPGGTFFKFGGEKKLRSFEKIFIPCIIAGRKQFITVDVIESNIPLLLSKEDMK